MEEALRRRMEIIFILVLLVVLLILEVTSLQYPPKTRQLPLMVNTVGIILLTTHLVGVVRKKPTAGKMVGGRINLRNAYISLGCMAGYIVLVYFIGMLFAMPFLVYGNSVAFGGKNKIKMAIVAIATPIIIYLVFTVFLNTYFYEGIFFGGRP